MMKKTSPLLPLVIALGLTACASQQSGAPAAQPAATPATAAAPASQKMKSRDGKYEGEVLGKVVAGSKFSKMQIGMQMSEVQDMMGRAPDRLHTYESGKRWIPFYFGNDARRMQVVYKGEGCLIFTGGNIWGGAGGDLIAIEHDATGNCYKP